MKVESLKIQLGLELKSAQIKEQLKTRVWCLWVEKRMLSNQRPENHLNVRMEMKDVLSRPKYSGNC